MKLIIEIPDEMYKDLRRYQQAPLNEYRKDGKGMVGMLINAIQCGTVVEEEKK